MARNERPGHHHITDSKNTCYCGVEVCKAKRDQYSYVCNLGKGHNGKHMNTFDGVRWKNGNLVK